MKHARPTAIQPRMLAAVILLIGAAAVGLVLGFKFGASAGGSPLMGVVGALCGATFLSLLADGVASRIARHKR